jgi:hypothetical protein
MWLGCERSSGNSGVTSIVRVEFVCYVVTRERYRVSGGYQRLFRESLIAVTGALHVSTSPITREAGHAFPATRSLYNATRMLELVVNDDFASTASPVPSTADRGANVRV